MKSPRFCFGVGGTNLSDGTTQNFQVLCWDDRFVVGKQGFGTLIKNKLLMKGNFTLPTKKENSLFFFNAGIARAAKEHYTKSRDQFNVEWFYRQAFEMATKKWRRSTILWSWDLRWGPVRANERLYYNVSQRITARFIFGEQYLCWT